MHFAACSAHACRSAAEGPVDLFVEMSVPACRPVSSIMCTASGRWRGRTGLSRPGSGTCGSPARESWLFRDVDYGRWGLHLLDPSTSASFTERERAHRPEDVDVADVVIGEFLGDLDLLLVDGDGGVLVALPLDPRADWYRVAADAATFLTGFLETGGEKYWGSG